MLIATVCAVFKRAAFGDGFRRRRCRRSLAAATSAAFGGCGEPCRGIIGDARLRPLFECGDECFPREMRADSMRHTASMVRCKT